MMDINLLYDKDDKVAYRRLLELETVSESSDEVYCYFDEFERMLKNEKSFIRVRGFRLIAKNAKWDKLNKINGIIDDLLMELEDEKPTAVRQCLKAILDIVIYKKELNDLIKKKLMSIDCLKYKDSMQGLIRKDVEQVLNLIESL